MMKSQRPLGRFSLLFLLLTLATPIFSDVSSVDSEAFVNPSEDYDDVNSDGKKPYTTPSPTEEEDRNLKPCYQDICNDLPGACYELQQELHCSCPGVAQGPSALPETPVVMVWPSRGEKPEVRWCAAHAPNTTYRVLVGGVEMGVFGDLKRSVKGLRGVAAGAEVCVQAENEMGRSPLEGMACRVYEGQGSPGLALRVGLIGGGVALALLILIIALLLWRRNSRKKDRARGHAGPL